MSSGAHVEVGLVENSGESIAILFNINIGDVKSKVTRERLRTRSDWGLRSGSRRKDDRRSNGGCGSRLGCGARVRSRSRMRMRLRSAPSSSSPSPSFSSFRSSLSFASSSTSSTSPSSLVLSSTHSSVSSGSSTDSSSFQISTFTISSVTCRREVEQAEDDQKDQ